ncbi:hypothetical protein Btru_010999 [Bulinus truncatus]|nr:hypothetical protein Btru_010999 [Bulinus truncatus]
MYFSTFTPSATYVHGSRRQASATGDGGGGVISRKQTNWEHKSPLENRPTGNTKRIEQYEEVDSSEGVQTIQIIKLEVYIVKYRPFQSPSTGMFMFAAVGGIGRYDRDTRGCCGQSHENSARRLTSKTY